MLVAGDKPTAQDRRRGGDDRRQQVRKVPVEQRKPQPAQQSGRRKVKTQAGAQRYGVAVGQYIPEKASGAVARGQQGERTKAAQDLLIKAGFLDESSGANKGRDGKFGPKTEAAVKAFQKQHGLEQTGQLDARTMSALQDAAPGGDPPGGKVKRTVPTAKDSDTGPAKAPGEPKPDGTQTTADTIVAKRMEHYGLEPRNPRLGAGKLLEDEVPAESPDGAKIVDFNAAGVAIYSDGSVYDGNGWQPGKPAKRKGESKSLITTEELAAARRLAGLVQ